MRKKMCINQNWQFKKDNTEETVTLPHTWNAQDGQDGGNDYCRGVCVYTKMIPYPSNFMDEDEIYLEFRGVNASAEVKVNGKLCGKHDGGYSTFRVNITDALKRDGNQNKIEVLVDNSANIEVYPQKADFTFYGGIYRDVYLIGVPKNHFEMDYFGTPGIQVTPDIQDRNASVNIKAYTKGVCDYVKFSIEGVGSIDIIPDEKQAEGILTIPQVHLWNGIEDPYLYSVKAEMMIDGECVDEISTKFGCRSYAFDPEKGFFLNGNPYPLHGVSRHQDRKGVGNALTQEMHDEDMTIILDMGANSIRLAHYQHDQYFYDLCDEKGIIVWAEIPYISEHVPEARENTITQMTELIVQNYNHASIICWALSNEITAAGVTNDIVDNHRELNDLVHRLDPSRVTVMANVFMLDTDHPLVDIPDIMSYNLYYGWYIGDLEDNDRFFDEFHEKYPKKVIGLSEYGADAVYKLQAAKPHKGDYSEQYQSIYHEHMLKMFSERPYLWSTYAWNMFDFGADGRDEADDNGVNHKGLVSFDRKIKKDAYYIYKAWWSKEPFLHICSSRYVDRTEDITEIKVYSNLNRIALYKDGVLLEEKTSSHIFTFEAEIEGEHIFEARSGKLSEKISVCRVDHANPDYYLESSMIQNWFEDENLGFIPGYYSVQDTMADIKEHPKGKLLLGRMMAKAIEARGDVAKNVQLGPEIEKIMDRMTVLELAKQSGGSVTQDMVIDLNKELIKIGKA